MATWTSPKDKNQRVGYKDPGVVLQELVAARHSAGDVYDNTADRTEEFSLLWAVEEFFCFVSFHFLYGLRL